MALFSKSRDDTELVQRNAQLEEEIVRLKRRVKLLSGPATEGGTMISMGGESLVVGATLSRVSSKSFTLAGADFGTLGVDEQLHITQINQFMAALFNREKSECLGKPVATIDNVPWAPEVLITLLMEAKALQLGKSSEFETVSPAVPSANLPERRFHFKATCSGRHGPVIVTDVTSIHLTRRFFERLVSPQIVNALLNADRDPARPQRTRMTVVFADLRNFTDFCQVAPVETVQRVCNEFFDLCSVSMSQTAATLDKFVGDQVMALFGAPIPQPDHAVRGVYFGVLLQHGVTRLRDQWIKRGLLPAELLERKPECLMVGVGVNSAEMIVGLFGNERTGQYTALGHEVNLCARMCGVAAGGQILAGNGTLDDIKLAHTKGIVVPFKAKFKTGEPVAVKGLEEPVPVINVMWQ